MKTMYTTTATATAGREGRVSTADGNLDAKLTTPREMGGGGGQGTNPEQLFAAGYAACFGSALKYLAGQQKIQTGPVAIEAEVSIGQDDKGFGLAVKLTGHLPALEPEQAMALMHAAHDVCPYSRATRGNIPVELALAAQPVAS